MIVSPRPTSPFPKLLLALFLITGMSVVALKAQPVPFDWRSPTVGNNIYGDDVRDIAVDTLNNYIYAVGMTYGGAPYGLSAFNLLIPRRDGFLIKLNLDGSLVWAKTLGGSGSDELNAVSIGPDGNIYVTGSFQNSLSVGSLLNGIINLGSASGSDIMVASYAASDGSLNWIRSVSGPYGDDRGTGIVALSSGIFITGDYRQRITFTGSTTPTSEIHNSQNVFIAKYTATGTFVASCSGGTDGNDFAGKLATDGTNLYTTGYFQTNTGFRWRNTSGTAAVTWNGLASGDNLFVLSVDQSCNLNWARNILNPGGPSISFGAIAADPGSCGNIYVAGSTHNNSLFPSRALTSLPGNPHDFLFLAALGKANGNTAWLRTATGPVSHANSGLDLDVGPKGEVYLSGTYTNQITWDDGTTAGGSSGKEMFAARFTSFGESEWFMPVAEVNDDVLQAVAVGKNGALFLGGYSNSLDLFLGRVSDTGPSLWPNPSNFELPTAYCQGSGPLDLNALLTPLHGGNAVAIISNSGVSNLSAALGAPDGNGVQFTTNGSSLGVDLGEQLDAGGTVQLVWRKATTGAVAAKPKIEVSPNGTTWTLVPEPTSTTSTSFIGGNFTLPIASRYIRVQKEDAQSIVPFVIDAFRFKAGTLLGGTWSGLGVNGSTFTPAELTGPQWITYTVSCYSTTKVIQIDAPALGGTLSGGGSACLGTEMQLVLTGQSGTSIIWRVSTDGGTTWVNDTTNQATYTLPATATATRLRARLTSGSCPAAMSNMVQVVAADNIAPVLAGCPGNITAYASATDCSPVVNYTLPTATDNCPGPLTIIPQNPAHASGGQFPLGNTVVTIRASDTFGNVSTCNFTITVLDTVKPTITCPAAVAVNTSAGCSALNVVLGTPVASDNCGSVTVTNNAPSSFPLGITNVVWTATDASGNKRTCIQTVTVTDNTPPSITCPADRIATANAGCAASSVNLGTPVTADNCAIASVSNNATSSYTLGVTTVTWTVMDNAGNTNTCTQHVTVTDITPPTLSCPPTVQVAANNGCNATGVNLGNPVAADNCDVVSLTNDAPSTFPLGTTTVTWTAADISGNTATCTQTVKVTDQTAPIALCREITVNVDDTGWAHVTAAMVNDGSSDNCTLSSMSVSPQHFNSVGDHEVTLMATDAAGNSSVCSTIVHVVDNSPPTAICAAITVYLDASGETSILAGILDGGSVDNDSIVGFSASQTVFTCADLGTVTDTLTVTDNSGNTSFCIAQVTVLDTVAPVVICQATDVYLNASGQATIAASALDNGSSDACGPLTFSASQSTFSCTDIGTKEVTLTATDASGNSATCTTQVTVHDTLAPVAQCQAATVYMDADGLAQIPLMDVDAGSTDNCNISARVVVPSTLQGAGDHNVQLIITDASGNTDSCMAIVTVLDSISPVALCRDTLLQLGTSGTVTLNAIDLDAGSSDNDGITHWAAGQLVFGCADVGVNADTLFVTDASGNTSFCVSTITIVDPFIANAGTDSIAELCAGGASSSLFPFLGPDAQAGGSWWFQGQAITNEFDPATDTPGDYLYTVANTSGCQVDSAVVHIVVHPNAHAGQDTSITVCSSATAFALIGFLPGADAGGTWSNGTGWFDPTVDASGTLLYTVNGLADCPATTASVSIQVHTAPDAGDGGILTLCSDASAIGLFTALEGTPMSGGQWTDPLGQPIGGQFDPTTMNAGNYTYTVSGTGPCAQANSMVAVSLTAVPSAAWSSPDPICSSNAPLQLVAFVTGAAGGTWSGPGVNPGSSLFNPANITVQGSSSSIELTYTVTENGCQASAMGTLVVLASPLADAGDDLAVCGLVASMHASASFGTGQWSTSSDVTFSSVDGFDATIEVSEPGTYELHWTVANGACANTATVLVTFHTPEQLGEVYAGPDESWNIQRSFQLQGVVDGATETRWTLLEGSGYIHNPEELSTEVSELAIGTNSFLLSARVGVCPFKMDTVILVVRDLFIPSGYSPNGDGVNDNFEIVGIDVYPDNELTIFNRWGQVVYQATGYANEWNGQGSAGSPLMNDTYFYVLKFNREGATYNGQVIIKR